jgi:hypothetical protein
VSTSRLQRQVSKRLSLYFGKYIIRENCRPEWLYEKTQRRLELDFFIEELGIAIEVQGAQHYIFTDHFHSDYHEFLDLQKRDMEKAGACRTHGITLLEIASSSEILPTMRHIKEIEGAYEPPETPPDNTSYNSVLSRKIDRIVYSIEKLYGNKQKGKGKERRMATGKLWQLLDKHGLDLLQRISPRVAEAAIEVLKDSKRGRRYLRSQ